MKIEVTKDGYWTDAEGNRWRLVPVKVTAGQTDAAMIKARKWRKDSAARVLAWDYLQGYNELVEQAPPPVLERMVEADAPGRPRHLLATVQDSGTTH